MIDEQIKTKLRDIGKDVKTLLPGVDGNIQFNLSRNHSEPKVNINIADVTKRKN